VLPLLPLLLLLLLLLLRRLGCRLAAKHSVRQKLLMRC
jgi:hypothetical protein